MHARMSTITGSPDQAEAGISDFKAIASTTGPATTSA